VAVIGAWQKRNRQAPTVAFPMGKGRVFHARNPHTNTTFAHRTAKKLLTQLFGFGLTHTSKRL